MVNEPLTRGGLVPPRHVSKRPRVAARRCFQFYENRALSNSPKTRASGRTAFSNVACMVCDWGYKKHHGGEGAGKNVRGQDHVFASSDGSLLLRRPRAAAERRRE